MQRRRSLTQKQVEALRPKAARYAEPDPDLRGHYVRVSPNGVKTFVAVARDPFGKQVWATIGTADIFKIDEARERAREAIKRIRKGEPAFEAPPPPVDSFKAVAESYVQRHLKKNKARTTDEIERCLRKYIYPQPLGAPWESRLLKDIKRSDVAKLLDYIEDHHGARQADVCLTIIAAICNWHAARDDKYVSPIVRGMKRDQKKKRARILSDDEISLIWRVAETGGKYGALVRLALLTAQRIGKIATMRWADVADDGTWTLPSEAREKGNIGKVVLPGKALTIIREQTILAGNPYVFPGRGNKPLAGDSPLKRAFDKKVSKAAQELGSHPPTPWIVHDLRRTARSLMARAGVRPDVAERVLGHVVGGVEGVYDRHSYEAEKADALARLASVIDEILAPRPHKIVKFEARS